MLSVVIPIYNSAKYLRQCLDSILEQTYKNIELILVDDGSSDASIDICKEYYEQYDNIKLIKCAHKGVFFARKIGVRIARGEYITFVDSDDFIAKEAYSLAAKEMQLNVDVISFDIYRFFSKEAIRYDECLFEEKMYDAADIKQTVYSQMIWDKTINGFGIDPALWNKIYRTSLVRHVYSMIREIDFQYGEDVLIVYPVLASASTIKIKHCAYYYHRQREKGAIPAYIADGSFLDNLYELYKMLSHNMRLYGNFQKQIDLFYANAVGLVKLQYGIIEPPRNEIFPFDKVPKGKNVVIYGAGAVGKLYVQQIKKLNYCSTIIWVDQNYKMLGGEIKSPQVILQSCYDFVVIAVADPKMSNDIFEYLRSEGVAIGKILRRENRDFEKL